jgi:chlorite dismutase
MALDIQRSQPDSAVDISEKGRRNGKVISSDRRLYMQLLVYTGCRDASALMAALEVAGIRGALYHDVADPAGIGLLTVSEEPDFFVTTLRETLTADPFWTLIPKPALTMFGRTYSIGYEDDLDATLITRPLGRVTDPERPWAVWYPVRRHGSFARLSAEEQRTILMEHGGIGRAFGRADLGYDVRLACYGLDAHDNDFVIGLIGKELFPLSSIVERMRSTKQTAEYLSNLGPFFIGKAAWQNR